MKLLVISLSLMCLILPATTSFAVTSSQDLSLNLYVDAAPNNGFEDYAPWESSNFAAVINGTYTNMANSADTNNVGTTNFAIQDEVVYSFGDLGRRLTWTYWIPNTTVAALSESGRFEISLTNIWGDDVPLDFYDYYYDFTWQKPSSWEDYNDGVIGTAGMAWWGAYYTNTAEELAADIADWGSVSESWIFTARLDGVKTSITSHRDAVAPVPEPSTVLLLGSGLAGLAWYSRKRKKV